MAFFSNLERFVTGMNVQFAVNGAEMIAHRPRRNMQRLRNLGIRQTAFRQLQYLDFALGKHLFFPLRAGGTGESLIGLRTEIDFSISYISDNAVNLGDIIIVFEDITMHAGLQKVVHQGWFDEGAEQANLQIGEIRP